MRASFSLWKDSSSRRRTSPLFNLEQNNQPVGNSPDTTDVAQKGGTGHCTAAGGGENSPSPREFLPLTNTPLTTQRDLTPNVQEIQGTEGDPSMSPLGSKTQVQTVGSPTGQAGAVWLPQPTARNRAWGRQGHPRADTHPPESLSSTNCYTRYPPQNNKNPSSILKKNFL